MPLGLLFLATVNNGVMAFITFY